MQDLSKYSVSQLRTLEAQVIDELKTRHFLSISQAREQILHIARNAGITLEQLLATNVPKPPKPQQQGTVELKYRNPADPAQGWSGRGRQPGWVKDLIESGKSIESVRASS